MKQQLNDLLIKLAPTIAFIKRYLTFSVVLIFLVIYTFLTFRINVFSRREPGDSDVTTALKAVPRPKVDQATLDKIQQLQDQHVEVKSLFDQARSNPFSE
jgi:hypothetical protein